MYSSCPVYHACKRVISTVTLDHRPSCSCSNYLQRSARYETDYKIFIGGIKQKNFACVQNDRPTKVFKYIGLLSLVTYYKLVLE